MKNLLGIGIAAIVAVMSTAVSALPDRIGDFGLMDSDGSFHQLSRYKNLEAVVLMSFDNSCAATDSSVAGLQAMQAEWSERGIGFALINSSSESDVNVIRSAVADRFRD